MNNTTSKLADIQPFTFPSNPTTYIPTRQYGIKRNTPKVPFFNRLKRK